MPFIPIPDTAEAVIHGTCDGKPVANVLGFSHVGLYSTTDISDLADMVDAHVGSSYKPLMTAGMSYDSVLVRGLNSSIDISSASSASAGAGGVSGAQLNNNDTLCITLRSAFTGRSARGRFYAFPTGASQLAAANQYSSTYAANLVNFLSALKSDAATIGWTLCIISRQHAGVVLTTGTTYPVVSIEARNLIADSQRGRLPSGH